MDFLNDYMVLAVVAVCLCVGFIIKNIVPTDKVDKFIPLIMGVLGVGMNIWLNLDFTPEILIGGLVSGLSSTGMYELFHQFIKKG